MFECVMKKETETDKNKRSVWCVDSFSLNYNIH